MNTDKEKAMTDIVDMQELAAELEKLPEAVRMKILYVIEGARLVSEEQQAG